MNILPKKSWHVRNKNNIERVRRDEEQAAEKEKERLRRVALAEQEARIGLLRSRAKSNESIPEKNSGKDLSSSSDIGTIPFLNNDNTKIETNKDYQIEKREEKEKKEKAIGLLTYLGQTALDSQTKEPWYLKKQKTTHENKDNRSNFEDDPYKKQKEEPDLKRKYSLDPINEMNSYLKKSKKKAKSKKDEKKSKKHEHKTKKSESNSRSKDLTNKIDIAQMRAERLRREQDEHKKAEQLLGIGVRKKVDTVEMDDRKQSYNSQFNPDFVRVPKNKSFY